MPMVKAALEQYDKVIFQFKEKQHFIPHVLENRYIINDKIGFGGFGTVFDAVDARRNISIVVKVITPNSTSKVHDKKEEEILRLLTE